jgi:hypothetical protein
MTEKSDPAQEYQDQDNDKDDADDASRSSSPGSAIAPVWQRPNEQQHQYDEKNCSDGHIDTPLFSDSFR